MDLDELADLIADEREELAELARKHGFKMLELQCREALDMEAVAAAAILDLGDLGVPYSLADKACAAGALSYRMGRLLHEASMAAWAPDVDDDQ